MLQKLLIKSLIALLFLAFPLLTDAKSREVRTFSKKMLAVSPAQNELFVLSLIRRWYDIQAAYYNGAGKGDFGTFQQLRDAGLIDDELNYGHKYGYSFEWTFSQATSDFPSTFSLRATPRIFGKTGRRSFYIDTQCKIRAALYESADQNSPLLETCTPYLAYQNELRLLAIMRTLSNAEETYRATVGAGNYAGSLTLLYSAGLINEQLSSSNYQFYYFTGGATPGTTPLYFYRSRPVFYGVSGFKSFYIDQTGIIRGADHQGGDATVADPPIVVNEPEN